MLATSRVILRRWEARDREPFARLNADPRVMEFMPGLLSRSESDAMIDRAEAHFERHGFGPLAAELRASRECIGFLALSIPSFEAAFMPCVEIGWRLAAEHWGQGLATEGARELVRHAFDDLKLDELVSFTTVANWRSRRVMEKLGFRHCPEEDFAHPRLPLGNPLRPHVLYRLSFADAARSARFTRFSNRPT